MQISTNVPRTTEVVALKPTAATLQEATRAPVSQDTPGTESAVQVREQRRMLNIVHQMHFFILEPIFLSKNHYQTGLHTLKF